MALFQAFSLTLRLLCLAILLSLPPTYATTFFPQPFTQTVQKAPIVLRGEVQDINVDQGKSAEGWTRIYTVITLHVTEVLRGEVSNGSTIQVRELGGEKNGLGMHVEGTARFTVGENIILFLNKTPNENTYDVHGMMMGKYDIRQDPTTQNEYLSGPGLISENQTADPSFWTLDRLRKIIHAQDQRQKSRSPLPSPAASQLQPDLTTRPIQLSQEPKNDGAAEEVKKESDTSSTALAIGLCIMGTLFVFAVLFKKRK